MSNPYNPKAPLKNPKKEMQAKGSGLGTFKYGMGKSGDKSMTPKKMKK